MSISLNQIVTAEHSLSDAYRQTVSRSNNRGNVEGDLTESVDVDGLLAEQVEQHNLSEIELSYQPNHRILGVEASDQEGNTVAIDVNLTYRYIALEGLQPAGPTASHRVYNGTRGRFTDDTALPTDLGSYIELELDETSSSDEGDSYLVSNELAGVCFETLEKWAKAVNEAS